ncbi:MAG: T9SS type A sorting domain-containing protein [Bacteroidales bacterium]|nr:T9SS type A sorting domain-containing protein [Bacteroidales bacterium]
MSHYFTQFFRKALLIIFQIGIFIPWNLGAQIVINANDFPTIGMLVVRDVDSTSALSPGQAGLNRVWDFSNLTTSFTDSTLYISPAGLPGAENHPGSNIVEKAMNIGATYDGSYNYIFRETTLDGWFDHGQELRINFWGLSWIWHTMITPAAHMCHLPMFYGLSYDQEFTWSTYNAGLSGGVQYDTSLMVAHLTVHQEVDGSGVIITPTGSFDALRVHEHVFGYDTVYSFSPGMGWSFEEVGYSEWNNYRWFAEGIGEVGSILEDGSKGGGNFSYFKSSTIVGTEELKKSPTISIYPVPAKDVLHITNAVEIEKAEIIDLNGNLKISVGKTHDVDVSGLIPGLYIIKIYTQSGLSNLKFTIEQ